MGGTTAKICLIDDAQPQTTRAFEVARAHRFLKGSGLPLRIPVIEMVEIGAGGGSIAVVDRLGRIAVGAGERRRATGAGLLRPGRNRAHRDRCRPRDGPHRPRRVLGRAHRPRRAGRDGRACLRIGAPLDLAPQMAALGVSEMVGENMAGAARVHAIEIGATLGERTMIAFGGAAPLHAARLAEKLDMDRILIPTAAAVGSAIGFLRAPVAYEVVRSAYQVVSAFDADSTNRVLEEMRAEAAAIVARGAPGAATQEHHHAYMRYLGQGHEVVVPLPNRIWAKADTAIIRSAFEAAYEALYGRIIPKLDLEIVSWSVGVRAVAERVEPVDPPAPAAAPAPHGARPVLDPGSGRVVEAQLYRRADFSAGGPRGGARAHRRDRHHRGGERCVHRLGRCARHHRDGTPAGTRRRRLMNGTTESGLARIQTQIMWNRLISVVEEQAQTLLRTAFSTTVREAGDLSAGVFDTQGRMLAQAVTGTPGHVNSMAIAVQHFLDRYPNEAMQDGDVYITNDPWLTCGHLHDLTVVTPVFREGRVIGSFACTAHVVDIGGRGFGPDARSVFEEGLYIPIMPLVREGRINEDLLEMVRWNVREPLQLEGDVHSLIACNRAGADRLLAMMDEFGLDDIDTLGAAIIERSRAATLAAIAELPKGTYRNTLTMDGYDEPITLAAAMTVSGDGIHVDFTGTSPASNHGINVVLNYTTAYTSFGLKCIVAQDIPNNAGSLAPLTMSAPEGSILNAPRPWPVAARHVIGHMLPDLVFGCLHQAIPDRVPAEGAASLWIVQLRGGRRRSTARRGATRRSSRRSSRSRSSTRAAPVRGRPRTGSRRRPSPAGCAPCRPRPRRRWRPSSSGARSWQRIPPAPARAGAALAR